MKCHSHKTALKPSTFTSDMDWFITFIGTPCSNHDTICSPVIHCVFSLLLSSSCNIHEGCSTSCHQNHGVFRIIAPAIQHVKTRYCCLSRDSLHHLSFVSQGTPYNRKKRVLLIITIDHSCYHHYPHIISIVSAQSLQYMREHLPSFFAPVSPSRHHYHSSEYHHHFHGSSYYISPVHSQNAKACQASSII